MAVQQNKVSPSRRNKRRSHDALQAITGTECPDCGEIKLPHHVCGHCGYYRSRMVIVPDEEILDEDYEV